MAKFTLSNGKVITLSDDLSIEEATDTIDAIERAEDGMKKVEFPNGKIVTFDNDVTEEQIVNFINDVSALTLPELGTIDIVQFRKNIHNTTTCLTMN